MHTPATLSNRIAALKAYVETIPPEKYHDTMIVIPGDDDYDWFLPIDENEWDRLETIMQNRNSSIDVMQSQIVSF